MDIREISISVDQQGGLGEKKALSGANVQSSAITTRNTPSSAGPGSGQTQLDVLVYPTVDCFMRQGANPVAVVDTDIPLAGGALYRLSGVVTGNKLAFITSGAAGSVWIYPGA